MWLQQPLLLLSLLVLVLGMGSCQSSSTSAAEDPRKAIRDSLRLRDSLEARAYVDSLHQLTDSLQARQHALDSLRPDQP